MDKDRRLVTELEEVFAAAGGPPQVLRMDNGPELVSQALQQFCAGMVGLSYIPPGTPWNNGYIESLNNRLRKECLNRTHSADSRAHCTTTPADAQRGLLCTRDPMAATVPVPNVIGKVRFIVLPSSRWGDVGSVNPQSSR